MRITCTPTGLLVTTAYSWMASHRIPTKVRLLYKQELEETGSVRCGICGLAITKKAQLTVDHIIPLSRGGDHKQKNLQPAHKQCNWDKGNQLIGLDYSYLGGDKGV